MTDEQQIGAVIDEMYAMISGPKGQRDWWEKLDAGHVAHFYRIHAQDAAARARPTRAAGAAGAGRAPGRSGIRPAHHLARRR